MGISSKTRKSKIHAKIYGSRLLSCKFHFAGAKGGFYSDRAGEFVISPNRLTKLFS